MTEETSPTTGSVDTFVRLADGTMHVVVDGADGSPDVVLIHGTASSTDTWAPIVPALSVANHVIRVDLLGHGRSSPSIGGHYGIADHARQVSAALDRLGVSRASVVAHSMGCLVAAAITEARPARVAALALIDGGPDLAAAANDGVGIRMLSVPGLGRLLWGVRTEGMMRAAAASAVTRPVELPRAMILAAMNTSYRAFVRTDRAARAYLAERDLPSRLLSVGRPLLVIFGTEDKRWDPASADAYRAVPGARLELLPGVGHTPMLEDPTSTARLLDEFLP